MTHNLTQELGAAADKHATVVGATRRPARALIGWMTDDKARGVLAGRNGNRRDPAILQQVASAQSAVAARDVSFDPTGALSEIPAELEEHVAKLRAKSEFALYRRHGWELKIADLRKVCAVQEIVHLDHAHQNFSQIDPTDMVALARICLPLQQDVGAVKTQWSEQDQHWILTSDNPNLHISAHFSGPQDIDRDRQMPGYGFCAEAQPSFVQVVRHRGRLILRDGYHRTLGLVAAGVTHIPVVFKEFGEFDSLGLDHGNLTESCYLGSRPATLFDYLDESVSAGISLSVRKTVIVIEAKRYVLSL